MLYTTSLAATYGGQQAVEYFKALDDGLFEEGCAGKGTCARKNLRLMHEYLRHGLPDEFTFGGLPIQQSIRHSMLPRETHAEWMRWMVRGRWNMPTTANPPHHVSKGAGASRRKLSKVGPRLVGTARVLLAIDRNSPS